MLDLSFILWLVNSELFTDLCASSKTGEYTAVQICFIVLIQLHVLTIISYWDDTSVKTNSLMREGSDGVSVTLRWIFQSRSFSACFTDYISLFWKLFFLSIFESWRAMLRWFDFLVVCASTWFISLQIPRCLSCVLPRACVSVSSSLHHVACSIPSSFASFPAFPSSQFHMPLLLRQKMAHVKL